MTPGIVPFRVLCKRCGAVAESWHRSAPAPAGATVGPASCECGAVSADSMGPPGAGRIVTSPDLPQNQWEVLNEPATQDTPENREAAEQELADLAAKMGRGVRITGHGVYLVGPRSSDDEERIARGVIGARDFLRWLVAVREHQRKARARD